MHTILLDFDDHPIAQTLLSTAEETGTPNDSVTCLRSHCYEVAFRFESGSEV